MSKVIITGDFTSLVKLNDTLTAAAKRPHKERARQLDTAARETAAEARAILATYRKASTGETAAALRVGGTPVARTVGAATKQAALLEYGTPTTGAPRPWLTGPAERAVGRMLTDIAKSAALW